jgi:hypothetical protein
MKSKTPPQNFWSVGQSFIVFSPQSNWSEIIQNAQSIYQASPFDIFEIGAENNITVVESRALEIEAYKNPSQATIKLCIIYNADTLNTESANTLLKIIEEPPAATRLLLFAETRNIIPTIKSRCSSWAGAQINESINKIKIPLDNSLNFATVSLRIAEIISTGETEYLLDQWTRELLVQNQDNSALLTWLILTRESLQTSPLNAQARLEATYLAISKHIHPPSEYIGE